MTRGKIIYIDKTGKSYSTIEFNGDMYPDGKAGEFIERFEEGGIENYQSFNRFVEKFNKRNYGYEEELIVPFYGGEDRVIDVANNWTDYLYIINESPEKWCIKARKEERVLFGEALGIVHYQQVKKIVQRENTEQITTRHCGLQKDAFVSIIYRLRDSSDLVNKVNELLGNSRENVGCELCDGASLQISHEATVIFLLKKIMQDKEDWIDYFIYELDYGRKYVMGIVMDEENNIDLSSAEKLYDYLCENVVID